MSNFLVWIPTANLTETNCYTGAEIVNLQERKEGFKPGTAASSKSVNTFIRQANLVACAIMDGIGDTTLSVRSTTASVRDAIFAYFNNASKLTAGTLNAARLPSSGATAGSYGQSENVTDSDSDRNITVPFITVDNKGRITSIVNHTIRHHRRKYQHNTCLSGGGYELSFSFISDVGTSYVGHFDALLEDLYNVIGNGKFTCSGVAFTGITQFAGMFYELLKDDGSVKAVYYDIISNTRTLVNLAIFEELTYKDVVIPL